MQTIFCGACGHENPTDLTHCAMCTAALDRDLEERAIRTLPVKTQWFAVGLMAMLLLPILVLTHFWPLLNGATLRPRTKQIAQTRVASPKHAKRLLQRAKAMGRPLTAEWTFLVDPWRVGDSGFYRQGSTLNEGVELARLTKRGVEVYRKEPTAYLKSGRGIFWLMILFFLAGAGVALLYRRRVSKEVLLGAVLCYAALIGLMAAGLGWKWKVLFGQIFIPSGHAFVLFPGWAFLTLVGFLIVGVGWGGSIASIGLIRQITGRSTCPHCGEQYGHRPKPPPVCPSCKVSIHPSRIEWTWVSAAVAGTVLLFTLGMALLQKPLDFYHDCDTTKPSARCRKAFTQHAFPQERLDDDGKPTGVDVQSYQTMKERTEETIRFLKRKGRYSDAQRYAKALEKKANWELFELNRTTLSRGKPRVIQARVMLFNRWRYMFFLAFIFMIGPSVLAWRLRNGALASAGVSIPLSWLGATAVLMIVYRFGGFEGSFAVGFQTQLIALLVWSAAGLMGAMAGYRLGGASSRLTVDEDEDPEEAPREEDA